MAGLSWRGKRTLDFPRFAGYNDHDQEVRINSDVHQRGAPGSCSFRAALISSFDSQVSGSEEGRAVLTSTAKTPACTTPRTGDIQKNGGTPCAPPFSLFHRARRILSFRKRENGGCIEPAIFMAEILPRPKGGHPPPFHVKHFKRILQTCNIV